MTRAFAKIIIATSVGFSDEYWTTFSLTGIVFLPSEGGILLIVGSII